MRDVEAPLEFPNELVGADSVRSGQLDDAAAFVVELLERPGGDIRVVGGQLELGDDVVVPGHPDAFGLEEVAARDPGVVWAIDGGSCTVADGRAFQVAAFRVARVRFTSGRTDLVESPPLEVRPVSADRVAELAREALTELTGEEPDQLPELTRPVDALREWAEWREVIRTIREADAGDLVLVDGSLHGGPLVPPAVVRRAHQNAVERGVQLAGVVKASTLYWGRHAPLVTLLKRRGDREMGLLLWATRISTDPVFGRLYVGDIYVAHLAPTAPYAFRVDIARDEHDPREVLGRLAALGTDPAFVGYPYPLARAHQAARVTGYGVADLRRAFRGLLARHGLSEDDIEVLFQDFHEVLNRN
ncbi:MAG: DNA double-strand break repair nuclease NurA [Actinomycetota bacterium]|nr:DNA double-strand break repair nuclease NurA [Actinomycetota bacterium]